jgi:hypothetical protein
VIPSVLVGAIFCPVKEIKFFRRFASLSTTTSIEKNTMPKRPPPTREQVWQYFSRDIRRFESLQRALSKELSEWLLLKEKERSSKVHQKQTLQKRQQNQVRKATGAKMEHRRLAMFEP